jgi:cell division protein FtsB
VIGTADRIGDSPTKALERVVTTLERLNVSLVGRDVEFSKNGAAVLRQMRWANAFQAATLVLMALTVIGGSVLLGRQVQQQERLAELADKVEKIDRQIERLEKTTDATNASVDAYATEPKVELEVRPAPATSTLPHASASASAQKPQLVAVFKQRKPVASSSASAPLSVVIPIEAVSAKP